MPPHCDARDGPVALAALEALATRNPNGILRFVPGASEAEMRRVFDAALKAHDAGPDAAHVAQEWLLETAVRLHREGEGASFDGLKPAGLDHGPVLPLGEQAIESGDASAVVSLLQDAVGDAILKRFRDAQEMASHDPDDLPAARRYTSAMLEFLVFSHHLHKATQAAHVHEGKHDH